MSLNIDVHRTRRFHMVRFQRAIVGNPHVKYPDPDDRGYLGPEFGPIVGVLAGRTVTEMKWQSPARLRVTIPPDPIVKMGPVDITITNTDLSQTRRSDLLSLK